MASIRKRLPQTPNGQVRWLADYVDQHGKRHNKTFATRKEARAWLDDYKAGVARTEAAKEKLLSLKQIRALPTAQCGIYFLFEKGELQRIGQSTDIPRRAWSHRTAGKVAFDDCRILHCQPEELDVLEALYIREFQPPHNRELQTIRNRMARAHTRRGALGVS